MTSGFWGMLQRRAPQVVLVVVMLLGAVGLAAFYIALKPCVVELRAGDALHYQITTQVLGEGDVGTATVLREEVVDVHLLILADDGSAVVLVQPQAATRGHVQLVQVRRNGQVLLLDGDEVLSHGPAIGYFDFNLMSLPPGLDQAWEADVRYAYPPPDKRSLNTRIRRTHNGSQPRFRWQVPAVEWVDRSPPTIASALPQRYVQMRELTTTYRFDTRRGFWLDARMQFSAGVEMPDGVVRHRIQVNCDFVAMQRYDHEHIPALRQMVSILRRLQVAAAQQQPALVADMAAALRALRVDHEPLRELQARWHDDLHAAAQPGWQVVQVATMQGGTRHPAELLRQQVISDGYPAFVAQRGGRSVVYAGPFRQRDEAILADLRRRFPANQPFWVTWGDRQ